MASRQLSEDRRSAEDQLRNDFPRRRRRRIILCFDGTGNRFSGTSADSNILKIYRMFDRNNGDKHYYQPGIGTYVNTKSLSHTSMTSRVYSWYMKAKDSAVGSSFDYHVMGAYKFLMSCYDDDDIFFFGFSRGAYVARFLAEMLDNVGLLSQGNEEMARFAWKAFAQWQERGEGTEEEKQKKEEMRFFLQEFRETFSRPVRRIRFLGLFDTVNSVPRFENAWMQRSKFPYTAKSSAKVIRHAVSIDERRAKFRQDLLSETRAARNHERLAHTLQQGIKNLAGDNHRTATSGDMTKSLVQPKTPGDNRFRRPSRVRNRDGKQRSVSPTVMNASKRERFGTNGTLDTENLSIHSNASSYLPKELRDPEEDDEDDEDEHAKQDIEEVWFPGCHADLGGGWPLEPGEDSALSHCPLVWMVREAQRAGLEFDSEKMLKLGCCDDNGSNEILDKANAGPAPPQIQVTRVESDNNIFNSPKSEKAEPGWAAGMAPEPPNTSQFHQMLDFSASRGKLHDCLEFNNGLPFGSVVSWKIMEYMPFRRMDLQPDGSWKAISLPLPMGEVRDIPDGALIHHSAIKRMESNPDYRPGNLIVGGGGRGVRRAPKEMGTGEWEALKNQHDPVGGIYVRKRVFDEAQKAMEKVQH